MSDAWNHGRSTYLKHKCRCEICTEDARVYREKYARSGIRLDGEPFIQRLTTDGRVTSAGSNNVSKWRRYGMDIFAADRWAVKFGYHPYEIWGDDFYQGCEDYVQG